jgi:hypothetical protein
MAHGLLDWPGDRMSTTPPHEAHDLIRAASRAGVGVQPTSLAVYGDESIFDPSLLDDRRLTEALPRALVAYLKSGEGQAARSAVADEYRQAMAKLLGSTVDPATAMSIAPARATATLRMMEAGKVKLLFGTRRPVKVAEILRGSMDALNWGAGLRQVCRCCGFCEPRRWTTP